MKNRRWVEISDGYPIRTQRDHQRDEGALDRLIRAYPLKSAGGRSRPAPVPRSNLPLNVWDSAKLFALFFDFLLFFLIHFFDLIISRTRCLSS
jgi:hypothetical protein